MYIILVEKKTFTIFRIKLLQLDRNFRVKIAKVMKISAYQSMIVKIGMKKKKSAVLIKGLSQGSLKFSLAMLANKIVYDIHTLKVSQRGANL